MVPSIRPGSLILPCILLSSPGKRGSPSSVCQRDFHHRRESLQTSSTINRTHYDNFATFYRYKYKMLAHHTIPLFWLVAPLLILAASSGSEFDVSKLQHSDASSNTTTLHVTNTPPTILLSNSHPTTMISTYHGYLLKTTRAKVPSPDISIHPLNSRSATGFRIFGYILAGAFVGTIIGLIFRIYFRQRVEVLCLALRDRFSRRVAIERRWYGR